MNIFLCTKLLLIIPNLYLLGFDYSGSSLTLLRLITRWFIRQDTLPIKLIVIIRCIEPRERHLVHCLATLSNNVLLWYSIPFENVHVLIASVMQYQCNEVSPTDDQYTPACWVSSYSERKFLSGPYLCTGPNQIHRSQQPHTWRSLILDQMPVTQDPSLFSSLWYKYEISNRNSED